MGYQAGLPVLIIEEDMYQESKYKIVDNRIVNKLTSEAIPENEPIFIIRAQDVYSVPTLRWYSIMSSDPMTVQNAIISFKDWQQSHPDQTKMPD